MQLPSLISGKRFTLPRPAGSADAVLLAQLAEREKKAGKLTAIVTSDAADAQRLMDELVFFAPDLRCVMFPDWETLPYDTFSPHQDLISERLATLWRIQQHDKDTGADVVLVPATTALYRLAPPSFLAGYTFQFKVKQKLDEAKLKGQLTLAGYQHVTQVVSPGEYAVRGGLIDLFPMGSQVPYRVDLFDESVVQRAGAHVGLRPGAPLPVGVGIGGGIYQEDTSNLDSRVRDMHVRGDMTVPLGLSLALVGGVGYEDVEISNRDALRDAARQSPPVHPHQHPAQIAQRFGIVRLEHQGGAEAGDRCVEFAQIGQHIAQIVVHARAARRQGHGGRLSADAERYPHGHRRIVGGDGVRMV